MSSYLIKKIKDMEKLIIEKVKKKPLHSPEVVKLSQEADKYVVLAMKKINNLEE